jgi:hypothetical protein
VTTTWAPGFFPSAGHVDTSPDGVTWTTQLSFGANTAASRIDACPGGQVSADYLRLVITAFPRPAPAAATPPWPWFSRAGTATATAFARPTTRRHCLTRTPSTQRPLGTTGCPTTPSVAAPAARHGGNTSWWQPTGAAGNLGALTLAVDLGAPEACRR